jgi:hypothetical protein
MTHHSTKVDKRSWQFDSASGAAKQLRDFFVRKSRRSARQVGISHL